MLSFPRRQQPSALGPRIKYPLLNPTTPRHSTNSGREKQNQNQNNKVKQQEKLTMVKTESISRTPLMAEVGPVAANERVVCIRRDGIVGELLELGTEAVTDIHQRPWIKRAESP